MTVPEGGLETLAQLLTLAPILACSVIGFAITLAKGRQVHRSRTDGERLLARIQPFLVDQQYGPALAIARADRSFAARLVERSLTRTPAARRATYVEQVGRELARNVEHGIGAIGLIATLGPLLGLFGTVVGIVIVFNRIAAEQGVVSASDLAGGIGTALYTTVAGLIVGVFALVSHRILAALADGTIGQLEATGEALVDLTAGHEA